VINARILKPNSYHAMNATSGTSSRKRGNDTTMGYILAFMFGCVLCYLIIKDAGGGMMTVLEEAKLIVGIIEKVRDAE